MACGVIFITGGGYPGMADLHRLDQCRRRPPLPLPQQLIAEVSPLSWEVWQECLTPHVEERFSEYIIRGIRDGFQIGFDYAHRGCRSTKENMRFALEHADVVRNYLAKECSLGRVLGPFDATLPFGLRSAPKIFTGLADALEWRLKYEGVETVFHYLDDFLIVSPPGSRRCGDDLHKLVTLFNRLRVPIAPEKLAGPSTVLTFLGVELDTRALIVRLPDEMLRELVTVSGKKSCLKKDPQSLTD